MIDQLRPDVIHAHDMQVVGIAAQAVERARAAGRDVPWVYDAHEFVPGLSEYGPRTRRVIAAWADLEQEYVRGATRVVTVSPADLRGAPAPLPAPPTARGRAERSRGRSRPRSRRPACGRSSACRTAPRSWSTAAW